jgi:hypothetical protein
VGELRRRDRRRKVYCVGDSGFGDGATFARVRRRHPGLALALLPIGAYEPRWFMRNNHINPEEAVEALALCGRARRSAITGARSASPTKLSSALPTTWCGAGQPLAPAGALCRAQAGEVRTLT